MTSKYQGSEFGERFGEWAVIAGGSDGIGAAFAREAARRGLRVAAVARRAEPLEALTRELEAEHGVEAKAIQADLSQAEGLDAVMRQTAALEVGLFVHNAGSNPKAAKFLDQAVDAAAFLVDLSCRAPVLLAHHFAVRMRTRGRGGLVFMSSLAGLAGSGYQASYAATKAFDTILAEGLWQELTPEGIDVLGVLAGATRTETVLAQNQQAFETAMDPAEVAKGALDHLGKGPNFVPGEGNVAAARGMWPVPRIPLVNGMTQASAGLFELAFLAAEGVEFHEG